MSDLALFTYAGVTGFTLAGLAVSVFELMAGRALKFSVRADLEAFLVPVAFLFRLVGGPLLLSRMALAAGLALMDRIALIVGAGLWSLCVGIVVLS